MTLPWLINQFAVVSSWPTRPEEPVSAAQRTSASFDALGRMHPTLLDWTVGYNATIAYPCDVTALAKCIQAHPVLDEDGSLDQRNGYNVPAWTQDERQIFSFGGNVCRGFRLPDHNYLLIKSSGNKPGNLSILTYDLIRAIMLAMIAIWEPSRCAARNTDLPPNPDEGWYAPRSWITYVPPTYAGSVDLAGLPHVEHLPDGGLLLSAVDTFFRADNPAHVEAARQMAKALRHLNDKPPIR